ncbi:hypothetical protein FA95DRAFT_1684663 [Auriscalpium vulgare]|uniref:Uncharacterized protein n=1 Tax=Auriscalpium vulgare TaxID=40419 RepID=A0ACB8R3E1_9AGAM|nr:hypothetical protein FA95DRAFT_1684663 [Auriscalpium vulgare]
MPAPTARAQRLVWPLAAPAPTRCTTIIIMSSSCNTTQPSSPYLRNSTSTFSAQTLTFALFDCPPCRHARFVNINGPD